MADETLDPDGQKRRGLLGFLLTLPALPAITAAKALPAGGETAPGVTAMSPLMRKTFTALTELLTAEKELQSTVTQATKCRPNPVLVESETGRHRWNLHSPQIADYQGIADELGPRVREFYDDNIAAYRAYYNALQKFHSEKSGKPELEKDVRSIDQLRRLQRDLERQISPPPGNPLTAESVGTEIYDGIVNLQASVEKRLDELQKKWGLPNGICFSRLRMIMNRP